jgi:hypothetical protein
MAITSNASYIPTVDEFLGHWINVNNSIVPALMLTVNNGSMDRGGFLSIRGALVGADQDIQDKLNDIEIARADIDIKKAELLKELNLFTGLLDSYYVGTKFFAARPGAPSISDGRDAFTKPLYDAKSLWTKLNAAPARPGLALPIVLSDGATQAAFTGKIAALEDAYIEVASAEQDLRLAREGRAGIQAVAYETMKVYRQAIPTKCAQHPALVATLPRLSPEPGATPDAVTASSLFEAPDKAKVVHSPITQQGIKKVQLRGHVGTKWDEELATTIAEHAPGAAPEFVTSFGLTQPGASVVMKVYVISETDNEAGSNAVVTTRPA